MRLKQLVHLVVIVCDEAEGVTFCCLVEFQLNHLLSAEICLRNAHHARDEEHT